MAAGAKCLPAVIFFTWTLCKELCGMSYRFKYKVKGMNGTSNVDYIRTHLMET